MSRRCAASIRILTSFAVDEEAFLACPEESIDYAVMERTADAVVMPMDAGWSDVGSWSSLWEISAHTPEGNVHHGRRHQP
ncbi:mannose-1-phosphate guanylyltransferase [Salmonella enterica subsp. enterica]|uniref:Mannose-1-phosphate guanylyltransferase n=1 Tax=Salmonella enterica I TaxID=59201 RepID=A0A447N7Z5_SALET|nr:mannose-1-phosphate guanylyltransferase [Salmonella enterica subsp. enterica]